MGELGDMERSALRATFLEWPTVREQKRFAEADKLRESLLQAGVDLDYGTWHPVFESSQHRSEHLAARDTV